MSILLLCCEGVCFGAGAAQSGVKVAADDLAAMHTKVDVPCTDESVQENISAGQSPSDLIGKAEFGQRPCSVVKPELKTNLTHKVGHLISYFYDGKIIDFNDYSPTGMCIMGAVQRPICNMLPRGAQNQEIQRQVPHPGRSDSEIVDCGSRQIQQMPGMGSDQACFSSLPVNKMVCGPDRANVAQSVIDDLNDQIAAYQAKADKSSGLWKSIYKMVADQFRKILNDADARSQRIADEWRAYNSIGDGYCRFDANRGTEPYTCTRELSWIRGMRVQIWKKHLDDVLSQIDNGQLNLTFFGSVAPCQTIANQLDELLNGSPGVDANDDIAGKTPGIRKTEAAIRSKYYAYVKDSGHPDAQQLEGFKNAGTSDATSTGCLAVERLASDPLNANTLNARTDQALKDAQQRSRIGLTEEAAHISQSVCNLAFARRQSEALFSKLLMCEVNMRAKQDYYVNFVGGTAVADQIRAKTIKPCADYAADQKGLTCWRACVTREFYKCYKGDITVHGYGNPIPVSKVLQQYGQSKWGDDPDIPFGKLQDMARQQGRAIANIDFDNGTPECKDLSHGGGP